MSTSQPTQPQMSLQVPNKALGHSNSVRSTNGEFDPCRNAKITSPFYLYNHDSPRPSQDIKAAGRPIHIQVTDLEAQSTHSSSNLQEKAHSPSTDSGKVKLWSWKTTGRCMTKPQRSWFKELPHWQRLLIKLLIAFLLIGAIVGVAVGVSVKVHGGIWKGENQMHPIGE